MSPKKIAEEVAGAAALAAVAAAGAYWFYGSKDAARHRKSARSWMLKARAETMEAVEAAVDKFGDIDKEKYLQIVKTAVKHYSGVAGVTAGEIAQITKDLTGAWVEMQRAKKGTKPAVKKAVKKTVSKSKAVVKKKR